MIFYISTSAWSLAYRALIQHPVEFYLKQRDKYSKHNEQFGLSDTDGEYCSTDLQTFHHLVTHDQGKHKQAPELMMQALAAVFLFR